MQGSLPNNSITRDKRILTHLRQHYGDDDSTTQQQGPSQSAGENANSGAGAVTGAQGIPLPTTGKAASTIFDPFKTHKLPFMILWDVSNILFAVLNVEYALVFNNVIGVYEMKSAGQFVAFVIGVGGVLTAMSELYVDIRTERLKKAHSNSAHLVIWPTVMVTRMLKMKEVRQAEAVETGNGVFGGESARSEGNREQV